MIPLPKDADLLEEFFAFIRARHAVFIDRLNNDLPTVKSTLPPFRFTNLYRILDRLSQFHVKTCNQLNLALEDENLTTLDKLEIIKRGTARLYINQLCNRFDVLNSLPIQILDNIPEHFDELQAIFDRMHDKKRPIFTLAYRVCTSPMGMTKIQAYMKALRDILDKGYWRDLYSANTVEERFNIFDQYRGFGKFLSYQFALTFSYLGPCTDYDTFVKIGPGCNDGMHLAYSWAKNTRGLPMLERIRNLQVWMQRTGEFNVKVKQGNYEITIYPRGNDVQNMFCEYSKFYRITHGTTNYKKRPFASKYAYKLPPIELPFAWKSMYNGRYVKP